MRGKGIYVRAVTIALGVAACVFAGVYFAGQGLNNAALWGSTLSLPTGVAAAAATWWPLTFGRSRIRVPPELEVPGWVVGRPSEAGQAVAALLGRGGQTVGITTGLHGAGGFGKTTLARIVCADPRIRRRFRGGVYLVTVGRDIRGAAAMAAKINDVIKLLSGEQATFADPEIAGSRLGILLENGPRRLLVVDDVWDPEQLAPFANVGRRCALLVTTRVPSLLGGYTHAVQVDQMSGDQARRLLMAGLPPLDPAVSGGLLAVTGRWPLLLRLVNKILLSAAASGADVRMTAAQLLARLRKSGPAVVDDLLGQDVRTLRVGIPDERARAVRATIEASTSLLHSSDTLRFVELGVFAEDETIPFDVVARLWYATAEMDQFEVTRLCSRLAELALVSSSAQGPGAAGLRLHDVVRDFLRIELGRQKLTMLNGMLLDASAERLPAGVLAIGPSGAFQAAWWEMDPNERYMWDHLIEHLLDADRDIEADRIASDLRWVGARLSRFGPAAAAADLSLPHTPRAVRLRTALTRIAHLLAPTQPPEFIIDVLHSRVADDPDWGPHVAALQAQFHRSRLVNRGPLPDLPDSALLRVLAGHDGSVDALAVAPDSTWLATADAGGTVRIWDTSTGRARVTLTGHRGCRVTDIAIAPDGSWLVTGGTDGKARIWDPVTGHEQIAFGDHHRRLNDVVIAPDGDWLATVDDSGFGGKVWLWDAATGRTRSTFTGRRGHNLTAVAVAPDGSWLAAGGTNGMTRIWDVVTKQRKGILSGQRGRVKFVLIAPDGSWLATVDKATVAIWSASGRLRANLSGYSGEAKTVLISPDGNWLATLSNGTSRIWDAHSGRERAILKNRLGYQTEAMAISPDSTWLATGDAGGTVRIWNAATGQEIAVFNGHNSAVSVMATAGKDKWLLTGDTGGTVRIWDTAIRQQQSTSPARNRTIPRDTIAPDHSWVTVGDESGVISKVHYEPLRDVFRRGRRTMHILATTEDGRSLTIDDKHVIQIWDVQKREGERVALSINRDDSVVVVSPDVRWLATIDSNGDVQAWDVMTGRRYGRLLGRHQKVAFAISPDSRWLATVEGGTIRIWDPATAQIKAFMRVDSKITAFAWPDSKAIAAASLAGLYLFDFLA